MLLERRLAILGHYFILSHVRV